MKFQLKYKLITIALTAIGLLGLHSCQPDDQDLQQATFSNNPYVFIDDFSGGMQYQAFGDSDVFAFDVDAETTYEGTQSMRFDIPAVGAANGSYAGGVFTDPVGRDLSAYNVLSFYMKSSEAETVSILGFGNYFGLNEYEAHIANVPVNTNWKKYYIPIPDAAKLTHEKGLFYMADASNSGAGYTLWIDEVQFEYLGTLSNWRPSIMNGEEASQNVLIGNTTQVANVGCLVNLPDGFDQMVYCSPSYMEFSSSNESVADVDESGMVTPLTEGSALINATMNGVEAEGSLTVNVLGEFQLAPTPTQDPDDVISIFSDAYTNVHIDYYNGYWEPYQTTTSNDFDIDGDHILQYNNFNFVGNRFGDPTIDASEMTHIHFDFYLLNDITSSTTMSIVLRDFGADGADGGGDDTDLEANLSASDFQSNNWTSIDIPLNMSNKNRLGLLIYEGNEISDFYLDNIYLYNDGSTIDTNPTEAAPTPTQNAADVLSIFSDAYTNVAGTNFNPDWGQSTSVSNVSIAGDDTLLLSGLNYQGIELNGALDVSGETMLHIDYFSSNSSDLNIYLISPGPVETPFALSVPTAGSWNSVDIPLSSFSPVDLTDVIQFKFDGNGDIYIDNLYFY